MINEYGQLDSGKKYYSGPFKNLLTNVNELEVNSLLQVRVAEIEFSWELLDYWIKAINQGKFTIDQAIDDTCDLIALESLQKWQSKLPLEASEVLESLHCKYHGNSDKPFNWENLTIAIEALAWLGKNQSAMWKLKKSNAGVDQMVGECVDMVIEDARKSLNGFLDTFRVKREIRQQVSEIALVWSLRPETGGHIIDLVNHDIRSLLVPIDAFRELLHYQVVKELLSELSPSNEVINLCVGLNYEDVESWSNRVIYSMYREGSHSPLYAQDVKNPWKDYEPQPKINSNIWE